MGDRTRGLYGKFIIKRIDGKSHPGEKHDGCEYFVLDLTHDPHAAAAIEAYAVSCGDDGYNKLASDLFDIASRLHANLKTDHTPTEPTND